MLAAVYTARNGQSSSVTLRSRIGRAICGTAAVLLLLWGIVTVIAVLLFSFGPVGAETAIAFTSLRVIVVIGSLSLFVCVYALVDALKAAKMLDWIGKWPNYWPLRLLIVVAALAIFFVGLAAGVIAVNYPYSDWRIHELV